MKSESRSTSVVVEITRMDGRHADLALPHYATEGSAGMDICAAVDEDVRLEPGERYLVPTGFAIALPQGHEAQVRPRSGLAIKHGIGVLNAPGTIDSDYRGEVKVIVVNHGTDAFTIRRGDRIAQMVIARYDRAEIKEVESLAETERGDGGFGHTGISHTS